MMEELNDMEREVLKKYLREVTKLVMLHGIDTTLKLLGGEVKEKKGKDLKKAIKEAQLQEQIAETLRKRYKRFGNTKNKQSCIHK